MQLEQVRQILEHVEKESNGDFKCYVSGGYLRDIMNGITPKDVDVMVIPTIEDFFEWHDLEEVLDSTEFHCERSLRDECKYMSDMKERGVCGLFLGEYNSVEVQFILYNNVLTQQELTEDMDINICQISMASDGTIVESDNFVEGFATNKLTIHHEYDEARAEKRIERMIEKYPHFKY